MRPLRIEFLQWYGLFGAALIWATQLVMGFGVDLADCSPGSARWGVSNIAWQTGLLVAGVVLALAAEIAAVTVLLSTRDFDYDASPPHGRRHFFAWGAALGNLIFLVAIVLSGIGAIVNAPCHQS